MKSALSSPTDWILHYIEAYLFYVKFKQTKCGLCHDTWLVRLRSVQRITAVCIIGMRMRNVPRGCTDDE